MILPVLAAGVGPSWLAALGTRIQVGGGNAGRAGGLLEHGELRVPPGS